MIKDGTKFNLKSRYYNVHEFAIINQKQIENVTNMFAPEMIVVCEIKYLQS